MKIAVVGTGYVGLVTGTCLSNFGEFVTCVDIDKEKIDMLNNNQVPIYENNLEHLINKNSKEGRLSFTRNIKEAVENNDIIFIAVGTPPKEDGAVDLQYVLSVAEDIGKYINGYKVIIDKSTVPVGTGELVKQVIKKEMEVNNLQYDFDVVSNPEFLREGKAVYDFTHPDRVVIGTDSEKAKELMKEVYRVLYLNQTPFLFTNIATAELIKYASNAFLAVKISFINEMALLSEKVGANIQDIARAMGMDGRISPKFLHAGCGYGGSCFPKDTKAITKIADENKEKLLVVDAAIKANEKQKSKMVDKIIQNMSGIENKTLCVLGLSFKSETDDVREAPSLTIITELINKGANIKVYCPQGMKETKWRLKEYEKHISYCKNEYKAAENSDALIIITEWDQFRGLDLVKLKDIMNGDFFFDLRNIYSRNKKVRELFKYIGVGIGNY